MRDDGRTRGPEFKIRSPEAKAADLRLRGSRLRICFVTRRAFPVVALFIFVFQLLTSLAASRAESVRLAVFEDVWRTIHERYYDPTFHGVDWEAARQEFRPLAADAQSNEELYAVLRRMIGELHDAHTRIYSPDEKFDWQHPRYISVGLSVREVGGQAVVVAVERNSEAERAGLHAGDLISSIDDEPALAVFARRLEQTTSSTVAAARLRAMATLFEGARETTVKVGWTDREGKERTALLHRIWRERDSDLRVRRLSGGYAVVSFDGFTPEVAAAFVRTLAGKLRDARGLVIDLRNNGGGEVEAMTEVASVFLDEGKSLGRFTDRDGHTAFSPQTRSAALYTATPIIRFRAPLIILTGERTSSAAEVFVAAMAEARRATVLGENTCGCVLAIHRPHPLPDGGELDISELDYRTAAGTRLEGKGLAPDERQRRASPRQAEPAQSRAGKGRSRLRCRPLHGPGIGSGYRRHVCGAFMRMTAIRDRFAALLDNPKLGKARGDLGAGYRTVLVGSHVVFYRLAADDVRIVRVLHQRMDPVRHLPAG